MLAFLRLALGAFLLGCAFHLQVARGLLQDLGRDPQLLEVMYGKVEGWLPFAHAGQLWRLPVDLCLVLPGLLLVAGGLARLRAPPDVVGGLKRLAAWPRALPALGLAAAVAVVGIGSWVLGWQDLSDDEFTYQIQTRMLARGAVTLPLPEDAPLFGRTFVLLDHRRGLYYGKYLLGWPAMLLPGELTGDLRNVLPVYAAMIVAVTGALGLALGATRAVAVGGALLVLASPFFLLTCATPVSQVGAALLLALALLGLAADPARAGPALAAGLAWGAVVNIRPASALAFGAPALLLLWRGRPVRRGLLLAPGLALGVLAMLATNHATTGEATTPASILYHPFETMGFSNSEELRLRHTPERALLGTLTNVLRLDGWLFGWPLGLALVAGLAFLPRREEDAPLQAWVFAHVVLYALYYYPGIATTGPLYWFELLIPLALLAARAFQELHRRFEGDPRLGWMACLLGLYGVLHALPQRLSQGGLLASVAAAPLKKLAEVPPDASLVVLGYRFRAPVGWLYDYPIVHPDLAPPDRPLLVRSMGDAGMVKRWQERRGGGPVYVLIGDARGPSLLPWRDPGPFRGPVPPWTVPPGTPDPLRQEEPRKAQSATLQGY